MQHPFLRRVGFSGLGAHAMPNHRPFLLDSMRAAVRLPAACKGSLLRGVEDILLEASGPTSVLEKLEQHSSARLASQTSAVMRGCNVIGDPGTSST